MAWELLASPYRDQQVPFPGPLGLQDQGCPPHNMALPALLALVLWDPQAHPGHLGPQAHHQNTQV